ncbi:lipoyl synthase [Anaeroselena agilis]|uniref:Lipoyl synthase n=1 Tax=Anaeroselena agilis TaxID=3063788 RepID=A0ABU3NXW6_9FIRM|nr:lipoyl synthase [Selenomonadales bacterium 4137-cl]
MTTSQPARPPWLVQRVAPGSFEKVSGLLGGLGLHTVCQSAHCPNIGECFGHGTATFLVLGSVCTRRCRFCAVPKGEPVPLDPGEPARVAQAAAALGLRHAVVTSVTRDDLPDGGAAHFAAVIAAIRAACGASVEVLTPDFGGSEASLETVLAARPEVFNHNLETVPRLYPSVRPGADYRRSLGLLAAAARRPVLVKSGLMLGLGEQEDEVRAVLADLAAAGVRALTLGQYLRPSDSHLPVVEYIHPDAFRRYEETARSLGFDHIAAGPLVRSSYHAAAFVNGPENVTLDTNTPSVIK